MKESEKTCPDCGTALDKIKLGAEPARVVCPTMFGCSFEGVTVE